MTDRPAYFTNILFIANCLAVGCTGSGTLGCGSESGTAGPTVDTELLGIYLVDQYQKSEEGGCDQMADVDPAPSRLVVYSVPLNDKPNEAALVADFCGSVLGCRQTAQSASEPHNYSFLDGSDEASWVGWGLPSPPVLIGDKECEGEVQAHTLTSTGNQAIRIGTEQVETKYDASKPEPGSDVVTCSVRDAINDIDENSPCTAVYLLEAIFEEKL